MLPALFPHALITGFRAVRQQWLLSNRWLGRLASGTAAFCCLASCVSAPHAPVEKPLWPYGFNSAARARLARNLAQAEAAWDRLADPGLPAAARHEAQQQYRAGIARWLRDWNRRQLPKHWQTGTAFSQGSRSYAVDLHPPPGDAREVSPQLLDRLILADQVRVPDETPVAAAAGFGVPVVGYLHHSSAHAAAQAATPPNGAYLTLTAVLEFGPRESGPRRCRLRLLNPLQVESTRIGPVSAPLAANFTAPKHLALNDPFLDSFSVPGMLFPEKTLAASRLYCLDPYDPKRIPVVFVHGLLSDPHIWFNMINAICVDPELRAHYQPWYFLYPTALAIPSTAALLRQSLHEVRDRLDPEHNDPGMNRMVLVGHSMGGLLSRMQTIDSRGDFWRAYFNCKPEELKLPDQRRGQLVSSLEFKRQPYIRRLIFIAVPHRGADIAQNGITHALSRLIRLPVESALLSKDVIAGNAEALSPQIRAWGGFSFLGLGTLSPKHPYLEALNSQPIPVPHHSIIANFGLGRKELTSDGVVPYDSAHLDTGTELVVDAWHNCAKKPEVVAEVMRRLREHLAAGR